MKILGIILITFGFVDLIGSFTEHNIWGDYIGIQLPDILWQYSSYIEIILGYFIINLSSKEEDSE